MCGPAAVVLAVAAGAAKAGGQLLEGVGQSKQYKYQAEVDRTNARMANDQAFDSIQNTNLEALRRRREQAQGNGQRLAAMAANGVDLNYGSAVDIQRDAAMTTGEDISQITKAGHQRTVGFEISAFNYRSQAAADEAKAKAALTGAIFGSLSTALGTATQVSKMRVPPSPQ